MGLALKWSNGPWGPPISSISEPRSFLQTFTSVTFLPLRWTKSARSAGPWQCRCLLHSSSSASSRLGNTRSNPRVRWSRCAKAPPVPSRSDRQTLPRMARPYSTPPTGRSTSWQVQPRFAQIAQTIMPSSTTPVPPMRAMPGVAWDIIHRQGIHKAHVTTSGPGKKCSAADLPWRTGAAFPSAPRCGHDGIA